MIVPSVRRRAALNIGIREMLGEKQLPPPMQFNNFFPDIASATAPDEKMARIVVFGQFDSHIGRLGPLRQTALQESWWSLIATKSARSASHIMIGLKVGEETMADSVYKVIEIIGTSTESWEKAAAAAVERASKTLRDLRVAEIAQLDMQVSNGKVEAYRAKVKLSFKFED